MTLLILSYLAGALTILSPCILPVLPFVFARADRPFVRSGLPLLLGLVLTFAVVASLATLGGGWVAGANQAGRWAALGLLALFGLALLWPGLAERLGRPLVALGNRLARPAAGDGGGGRDQGGFGGSLLLGVATGLLWAPCAGPVLGLILTGAALNGASVQTTLLLLTYAAGAASSLAAALLLGGRVLAFLKRGLGLGEWLRRGLGAAVLAGVALIALGLDTGVLAPWSAAGTTRLEQGLLDLFPPATTAAAAPAAGAVEGRLPSLDGASGWLNSPPLTAEALRGRVVLVDFWTYSCINCLRTLPYVRAWAERYGPAGLVVLGIHTPEFAFEKQQGNVEEAARNLGLAYPIALDNDYALWRAFNNRYWPAHYLIDAGGRIRHHHFGEGAYDQTEQMLRQLLAETGATLPPPVAPTVAAGGIEAAADFSSLHSPETYLGYLRGAGFASPELPQGDQPRAYTLPASLGLNQWALAGSWTIAGEHAEARAAGNRLQFRFQARDLHLVLGPGGDGGPVRFRLRLDGADPGAAHGVDSDDAGVGTVDRQRLYQLIRQPPGAVGEHLFEIEFLDPGVQAFAFTFG